MICCIAFCEKWCSYIYGNCINWIYRYGDVAEMYQECTTKFIFLHVRGKNKITWCEIEIRLLPQISAMEVTSMKIILSRYPSLT